LVVIQGEIHFNYYRLHTPVSVKSKAWVCRYCRF